MFIIFMKFVLMCSTSLNISTCLKIDPYKFPILCPFGYRVWNEENPAVRIFIHHSSLFTFDSLTIIEETFCLKRETQHNPKRFCEPTITRRSWETWWYDTSKQGIGALVIHMTNVYLAPLFQGDPCTWYIINFLLDSTIGLFIVYIGIELCHYLSIKKKWPAINFGEYGAKNSWIYQTCIYISLMVIIKLITTVFIQMDFWDNVKDFVLSPISNQKIEVAVSMLIIPFFVNMLIFWVTDNFLMRHNRKSKITNDRSQLSLLQRVKVKYRNQQKVKENESESEVLISDEDDDALLTGDSIDIANKKSQRINVTSLA